MNIDTIFEEIHPRKPLSNASLDFIMAMLPQISDAEKPLAIAVLINGIEIFEDALQLLMYLPVKFRHEARAIYLRTFSLAPTDALKREVSLISNSRFGTNCESLPQVFDEDLKQAAADCAVMGVDFQMTISK